MPNTFDTIAAVWRPLPPGPYRWNGNTQTRQLTLETVSPIHTPLMRFERWGIDSAGPLFWLPDPAQPTTGNLHRTIELARPDNWGKYHGLSAPLPIAMEHSKAHVDWLLRKLGDCLQTLAHIQALHKHEKTPISPMIDRCLADTPFGKPALKAPDFMREYPLIPPPEAP